MKAIGEGSTKKPPVITFYKGKKAVKKIMKHSSEGEIMKLLKGKENIAEIYDIEDHTLYMKLYNLQSLRDSIDNDEVYPQLDKYKYDIAYQIQNGLKQIHKLGYVHSDLKSSNILCEKTSSGEIDVYISDFGAARKVGSPMIEYSEEFADPKSLGKPLSFAIDFYSLGKIYIELFGGFPERSVAKINYNNYEKNVKISYFETEELEKRESAITFYAYVRECLNDDPKKRPSFFDFNKLE